MPTRSAGPTASDRLSATTTLPKLLETPVSSSRVVFAASGIRWLEGFLDLDRGVQGIVNDLHLERELAGGLLPLHADRGDDRDSGRRAAGEVESAAHARVIHVVQLVGDVGSVVRIAGGAECLAGHFEQCIGGPDRLHPLAPGL